MVSKASLSDTEHVGGYLFLCTPLCDSPHLGMVPHPESCTVPAAGGLDVEHCWWLGAYRASSLHMACVLHAEAVVLPHIQGTGSPTAVGFTLSC